MRTTFSSCYTSERRLRSQCLSNKAGLCALGKERTDFVGYDDPKGAVAEAFRALRTSLSLSPAPSKAKLLAVTSSVPSEGKSFVALNLALTYARGSKRVLLVSDTLNLTAVAGLKFLVVDQCLKTEKKQVEETCDTLRRVNAEVVGTVLQQGEKAALESGYSDYGYGYKYGYGYGADRATAAKTPWYRRFGKKA